MAAASPMTLLNVITSSSAAHFLSAKEVSLLAFTSKQYYEAAKIHAQEAMRLGVPSDSGSHEAIIAAPSFLALSHYEHLSHCEFMFNAIRKAIHQVSDCFGSFVEFELDDDAMTDKVAEIMETPVHEVSAAILDFSPTKAWSHYLRKSAYLKHWGMSEGNIKLVEGFLSLWPRAVTEIPVPFTFAPSLLCDMLERFLFPRAHCIFAAERDTYALWVFETKTNFFILHMEDD
eukprot:GEMP01055173.1.p1 GENE.GEMP01055173.1~~GEMP01055173.1.p1  ORF type:complete len:231 (+),score=45.18 GEMP01055173.1:155-847(+)